MKRFPLLLSIALTTLLFSSCSKDNDDDDNNNDCRIATAVATTGASTTSYTFAYNDQGKIASISQTSGAVTNFSLFTYTGNVILISRSAAGVISSIGSVVLASNGLVQYIKNRTLSSGQYSENVITYNGDQIASISSSTNGGAVTTQTTSFTSGNLTSAVGGSSITTYSYNADKPFGQGDYFYFAQISQYGSMYVKNKNQIASTTSGGSTTNFTYTYDPDGKISGLQAVSGSSITSVSYTYTCN